MKAWKILWLNTRKTADITPPEEMVRKSPCSWVRRMGPYGVETLSRQPLGSLRGQGVGLLAWLVARGRGWLVKVTGRSEVRREWRLRPAQGRPL